MSAIEQALEMHEKWNGKIETTAKAHVNTREDLAIAYTPGVAEPCKVIAKDPDAAYKYTMKANTIAVVSDGSAVLGLGNIGAKAAMPVMEGKAVLFKEFGGVNAVPICLDTQDTEEIIKTVVNIAPAFGGINLEDISAPRCFEIETRLKELLDIPVFHDDQHGTAIVVLAGIINALKVTGKKKEDCKNVVNGAGSAGVAITKLLLSYGFPHLTMCDSKGILSEESPNLNWMKKEMIKVTNLDHKTGTLADALKGADIFVGVSVPNIISQEMVASMNKDAILFALSNPVPEIMPDLAKEAGAKVMPAHLESYYKPVDLPKGQKMKKAKIHEAILNCDVWINVPILKNHGGANLTISMKNHMGIVWDRGFFHQNDLQQCIADICTLEKKAVLNVVDAYRIMKTNGPRGRSASDVVLAKGLFISPDIVAVDTAAAKFFNQVREMPLDTVGHLAKGEALKVGTMDIDKLNVKRIKM